MGGGKKEAIWYCCQCGNFWSRSLYFACTTCNHRRCPCCASDHSGKPENPSARRPQDTSRPVLPTQQPKPRHPLVSPTRDAGPRNRSDDQAPLGARTTSASAHAAGLPIDKLAGTQTSGEEQGYPDGEGYIRSNDQIVRLVNPPEAKSFTPAKTASAVSPGSKTGPIAQQLQVQLGRVGISPPPFAYSPPPAILSDCKDNDKGPQGAPSSRVPFPGLNLVKTDKTPKPGKSPTPKSVEQSPGSLNKPTRPNWPAALPAFRRSSNSDPATYFRTDYVARSPVTGYNDSDTTLPLISTVPSVGGVHDIASQELFHLLVQKVYRAICFDPSGSFRSRGGSLSGQDLAPAAINGKTLTTNRKRRLQGDYDETQNKSGDDDRRSSRTKRSRVKPRTLGALPQEFACPFCKRNFDYGYEARCIGWSNSSIDEVLRRHLLIHVRIEPQHLSEAKYERVNQMKSDYTLSDQSQAEELWIAAYMEIFEIDQRNRDTVPCPYLRREDFPLDSNHAAFFSRIIDTVGQNPASTIQIRSLVRGIEAIDRDINRRRERLREQFRAQEARFIQDNRARLEAAERELDDESDERHRRLGTHFRSILGLAPLLGQDASHGRLHESVGNRMPNNHRQFHIPDLLPEDQSRMVPWDRASTHVLEDLNSSRSNLTTSSMLGPEPRNHQAPVAGGNFHHSLLSVRLPSMDVDHNANEALLDSVERQTLSSTDIGESHADAVPANMVPPHADETLGVAPVRVLSSGGAGNRPNSQFERSPDSEYGSSYVSCKACNTVFMGQGVCGSCAVLDIEPSRWFNG